MGKNIIKGILILIMFVAICFPCSLDYQNNKDITCTIQDKWVKRIHGEDVYLVQCSDNVYKITDLLFLGKFNSSDVYAKLKIGENYELHTTGYRIHFLSAYPNINKYKKVVEE